MLTLYLQLILVYLKIGLVGFGGGYAMLSLIQEEVVIKHGWLTAAEFTDIIAVSQMTPGPIGINSATYIGYTITGSVWGSIAATIAVMIPSFVLVMLISISFAKIKESPHFSAIFTGIRPTVVGLIGAAALMLCNNENFIDLYSYLIFALAFFLTIRKVIHPILTIVLCGFLGYLIYI